MTGYYDLVLGLIPLTLAGVTGVLFAFGVPLSAAIPLSSVVSVGLIGHAMFVRTPVSTTPGQSSQEPTGVRASD